MKTSEELSAEAWKNFLRRHGRMALLLIGVMIGATIVAVFVFLRVVADAQTIGLVPAVLGQWSVGILIAFLLTVILWELVFVASWVIPIVVVTLFLWYRKLPDEEREEYGLSPRRGADPRRTEGGGFFTFLIGVIWLVIVWTTGRWYLAFQAWTFNDWIYSWLAAALWILVPLGIAGMIFLIWSVTRTTSEPEEQEIATEA